MLKEFEVKLRVVYDAENSDEVLVHTLESALGWLANRGLLLADLDGTIDVWDYTIRKVGETPNQEGYRPYQVTINSIEWDVDGEKLSAAHYGLPEHLDLITVMAYVEDSYTPDEIDEEVGMAITDYLTDEYGFCVYHAAWNHACLSSDPSPTP